MLKFSRAIEKGNYRNLLQLNFFLGVSISIVCATGLFDLLYLRMQFDLSWFGFIRSCMFLFPALCYFCVAPFLKGTPYSREIVQWSYLVRILTAVLIPLTAIFTQNTNVLLASSAVFTTIAYIAASFANNTLMVLYRQLLSRDEFNSRSASITAVFNITPSVVSLGGAFVLSLAKNLPDRKFYLLFILLEVATGIFELQVFRINRRLKLKKVEVQSCGKKSYMQHFRQAFEGLRSPVYRQLLLIVAAYGLFAPLLETYINIFLYTIHKASAFEVILLGNIASFGGNFSGILLGKLCDRVGYLKIFRCGAFIMLIFTLLFGYFQQYKWLVIFFMLFICGGGFLNGSLANLRGAAAAKFTPFQGGESYVAVFALISFLSSFIGSLLSGWIFVLCRDLAGGDAENHFGLYFKVICIPEIILLLPLYNRGCLLLDKKSN